MMLGQVLFIYNADTDFIRKHFYTIKLFSDKRATSRGNVFPNAELVCKQPLTWNGLCSDMKSIENGPG